MKKKMKEQKREALKYLILLSYLALFIFVFLLFTHRLLKHYTKKLKKYRGDCGAISSAGCRLLIFA